MPKIRLAHMQPGAHLTNNLRLCHDEILKDGIVVIKIITDALLPNRATNAWAVGASVDDVPTLSPMGGVGWAMGATANALSPGMVRT
jgi:hypothetical protein